MNEHFTCDECHNKFHIKDLHKRATDPGNYCALCGHIEKCAACGEQYHISEINFKKNVKNYICNSCEEGYLGVRKYIQPLHGRHIHPVRNTVIVFNFFMISSALMISDHIELMAFLFSIAAIVDSFIIAIGLWKKH